MSRRFILLAAIGISIGVIPATAAAQKGSMYSCDARKGLPRSPRATVYTTEILPINGAAFEDVARAWADYMKKTDLDASYSARCMTGDLPVFGQSIANGMAPWSTATKVATGWRYTTAMTAAPSKPGAVYAWCNSGTFGGDKTVYDTQVFEIGMGDARSTQSPVTTAFTNYLISKKLNKYIFQEWFSRSVACVHTYDSRTTAEEARAKAESQWKSQGKSVVGTDWIYPKNMIHNAAPATSH